MNLSGNLYAGCENAAGTGTSTTSVTIPNNATLDVKDTSYMIAEGDIEVGDFAGKDTGTIKKNMAGVHNNSTLSVDSQCQLWTSNINVNGATVNLDGMTYVADDMTLKGTGSKVTLARIIRITMRSTSALATEVLTRKILSQAIALLLS